MKKVSSKKLWMTGMTQPHVEPPPIPLIKTNHGVKSDKYFVTLNLRKDPTLPTSDPYEFKMSFFGNGKIEEFYCSFVTST